MHSNDIKELDWICSKVADVVTNEIDLLKGDESKKKFYYLWVIICCCFDSFYSSPNFILYFLTIYNFVVNLTNC